MYVDCLAPSQEYDSWVAWSQCVHRPKCVQSVMHNEIRSVRRKQAIAEADADSVAAKS